MRDDDKNKEYWDKRLPSYDDETDSSNFLDRFLLKKRFSAQEFFIIEQIKLLEPKSILEIGCGTGRVLELIHDVYPEIELKGIDQSESGLVLARKKLPTVEFSAESPSDLHGTYDLVLLVEVLLHNKPVQKAELVRQAIRLGSRVLVIDPDIVVHDKSFKQDWVIL